MDVHDARDDLADDERVAAHRERAKAMLTEIAQQMKEALAEQGIDTPCSSSSPTVAMPSSPSALLVIPSDDEWDRVADIVALDRRSNRLGWLGRDAEQ